MTEDRMRENTCVFICLGLLSVLLSLQFNYVEGQVVCSTKQTCSDCINLSPLCAWCKEENYDGHRCDKVVTLVDKCRAGDIVNPENQMTTNKNQKLSTPGTDPDAVVQLAPQDVTLRLRPGNPFPLRLSFRQAEDYPVDLYYLMDLSKSMEDDKDKLAQLGDLLAERMSNITKNFRLGFGSFVDKIVMPYVSTVPEKLEEPCSNCAAPYGFKNHMGLSLKTQQFREEVSRARVSGNLDAPEGGFDAIMQSIVCGSKIGWREKSRKLLVFSTDSGFHYAGDGKLGGIVKPNDGMCHLDSTGLYTESTNQDYPSLSQLNQKAIEKKVHMIFAVTANQVAVYEQLSNNLEGASSGKLEDDSANVVELIKNQYNKITSAIKLNDNAGDSLQVDYFSKCLNTTVEKTRSCSGLKVGSKVDFEVSIEVKECPSDPKDWKQKFTIYPVGLSENLTVNIEMLCECECERPENEQKNSAKCSSGNGTYECGICSCYDNRFGPQCQCDPVTTIQDSSITDLCIDPNGTNSLACNGRGSCVCGACDCTTAPKPGPNFLVWGDYCQCDDFNCDLDNRQICGGHGKCNCKKCECYPGWSGRACTCATSTEGCVEPGSNLTCNGMGACVCGKCVCNTTGYSGPYCSDCPACQPTCPMFQSCVQCQEFESGKYTKEECEKECTYKVESVDKIEVDEKIGEKKCIAFDDDDCRFTYMFGINTTTSVLYVRVQSTKECPAPLNILMIVLCVIGGIVAIGLCLLLIWKLLTTIHDRREFAKFEKERQMAKWDTGENPIFKQATSTFKNPTYGSK